MAEQVRNLVGTAFMSPTLLSRAQLSRLLCVITHSEGLPSVSRILGVSPVSVNGWRSGKTLPMFPVYLRLARTLNVSLPELITAKGPPRSIRLSQTPDFDAQKAQRLLTGALHASPPPSLNTFRKRTGYHYSTLRKHFLDLCKQLALRFEEHQNGARPKDTRGQDF